MKILSLVIFLITITINAEASFIASNYSKINPSLPTHVLVAGYPDKLGELFIYSMITKSKIYLEKSSKEQIIIVGRNEDKEYVVDAGFKIIDSKMGLLKPKTIKDAIKDVANISSIDIFAHSNALSGATLDTNTWIYQLLNEKDDLWDDVSQKINKDSFIFIHGCNAGIKFAPLLATKLKIAVFAALTSTDFQFIYKDSFWSFDYNVDGEEKSSRNNLSYSTPKLCGKYCTRMKPDNSSYKGHWGDWTAGGYPAYKLFCGSNTNANCERGALEAIFSFPSSIKYQDAKINIENFKKQLIDFMCPFAFSSTKQEICKENLEKSLTDPLLSKYSPFRGKTLVCDRTKCEAHFNCSAKNAAFSPGNCTLESDSNEDSTTFTDEFKYFVNTFNKNY